MIRVLATIAAGLVIGHVAVRTIGLVAYAETHPSQGACHATPAC